MRLPTILIILAVSVLPAIGWAAVADDRAELERLLHSFLASSDERPVHEAFWAEDLIYTSSAGERFGKADILAGFEDPEEAAETGLSPPSYGGEDVVVRVMDDLAVVTFRLFAEQDGDRIAEYFNTGVFRKDDGEWKAFTWQATRIPDPD